MKTWLNKVFMAKDNGDKAIVVEVGLAVIAVVLFFLVILVGIDALLGLAFDEFTKGLSGGSLISSLSWLIK